MKTYILGLIGKFGKWLSDKVKSKIWKCFFCKKFFSSKKPRINAFIDGMPIFQCESCRLRHEMDPTLKDTPPEGIFRLRNK